MPILPYYNQFNKKNYFYNNYTPKYIPNYNYRNMQHFTPSQFTTPPTNSEPNLDSTTNHNKNTNTENVWLDLFGIKLYFVDVLILSLLFFLYKEEVKDEGLFLALVLLLIS